VPHSEAFHEVHCWKPSGHNLWFYLFHHDIINSPSLECHLDLWEKKYVTSR